MVKDTGDIITFISRKEIHWRKPDGTRYIEKIKIVRQSKPKD